MRNPGGYACVFEPDKAARECDTFTCGHCNKVVHVPVRARPEDLGGNCTICTKLVCPQCVNTGLCDPFEEKLKREEQHYHTLRSYGLVS